MKVGRTQLQIGTGLAHAALLAVLTACSSSPVDVPFPSDVRIRLEVTAGFAGVSYSFVVDGAEGVVRGESCLSLCTFQPGDVLTPISDFQVTELARDLALAGALALHATDFGVACCDDFYYVLEYSDGARSATLRGTGFRFPDDIRQVIRRIHNFHDNMMPAVVALSTRPGDWPADQLTIDSVRINGYILDVFVTYGGGCRDHSIDLVAWNGWLESHPVRVGVVLAHDARGDDCRALIRSHRTFDLIPLRHAYQQAYGPGAATLLMTLPRPGQEDLVIPFDF